MNKLAPSILAADFNILGVKNQDSYKEVHEENNCDLKYCPHCGKEIEQQGEKAYCCECGHEITKKSKYCSYCGKKQ